MRRVAALAFTCSIMSASTAMAGGYDIPILYTAKNLGMGGTGVAYVDNGASLFINPAGLGFVGQGNIIVNASLLVGDLKATPYQLNPAPAGNIRSEQTIAPFGLLGGAYRVHDYVVLGLAAYPVAAASGEYKYTVGTTDVVDETTLLFIEVSPGIAVNIDQIGLSIGIGYRITYVSLDRKRNTPGTEIDLDLTGVDFASFRVGAQYKPTDWISFGVNYRHKSTTDVDGPGSGLGSTFDNAKSSFILPARISGGVRFDWAAFSTATDFEWGFNSQNTSVVIDAGDDNPVGFEEGVPNVFNWSDQWTLRWGMEYRFSQEQQWPVRVGFIYDSKTANEAYPTAFGTPPTSTYAATIGFGYDHGPWEINAAYARRYGRTAVLPSDLPPDLITECPACGGAGDYEFRLNGFFLDFSYDWERKKDKKK